jgi:hypothetical protein
MTRPEFASTCRSTLGNNARRFDCIAFKRQAQKSLREEYEKRADEFNSYMDFINAKVNENEWARRLDALVGFW